MTRHRRRLARALLGTLAVGVLATGCGSSSSAANSTKDAGPAATLRLGYFANVTHATPVVGVARGTYAAHLGSTKLETQIFNAGPAAVEALLAGSLDAAYVGPNPAINAFTRTKGDAVRIVAGATSGGASLVVSPAITAPAQLRGTTLATPQLGGTQDVALRAWLAQQGIHTAPTGGGDATIAPTENATTLTLFQEGKIDGAWVPEPWASRLVVEGGGRVLVDERSLWPGGRFVTTNLLVTTKLLQEHPATVRALLDAQVETGGWINANLGAAKQVVQDELVRITGKGLKPAVIDQAFAAVEITDDPLAGSLATSAQHATEVGLLPKTDLHGIYDLRLLNAALTAVGRPAMGDASLGKGTK
jgi:NitT/TauT family transport system substrate-binding protein